MKVTISEAAKELGVSKKTLRRWELQGKIKPERTEGQHRRYDLAQLRPLVGRGSLPEERITLSYARVSSQEQKEDLARQVNLLEAYCAKQGWKFETIQEVGSGLNYHKRGLRLLIKRICSLEIERIVLVHKDRLLRFGSELIFALCEQFGVEVVIINATVQELSFEEELVQDVLEIITVFSARLYGSRSRKNQQLMAKIKQVAEEL